ncbi:MAG: Signal peptidase I S [Parcubacteria group bacterium ADurb.Bin216]|nr:MAG: Signal peptidase I S [Parcubacteria group bacterium ADurb.Bin216]
MNQKFIKEALDLIKIVLISLAIVIPIRAFIFQPFMVKGASMEPNYHSTDYLIIDQVSYRFNEPERGDVIVFKYPNNLSLKYIKRIIAFPGEAVEIKDGEVFITDRGGKTFQLDEDYLPKDFKEHWTKNNNNKPILLGENDYFVMGDNRNYSSDSRSWGTLPKQHIIGKVFFTLSITDILGANGSSNNIID